MKRLFGPVFVLMLCATPSAAHAADTNSCADSFELAQKDRRAGNLLSAREHLVSCSQPACVSEVASKCSTWLDEVNGLLPSAVVVLPAGVDPSEVELSIDGQARPEGLRGRAVSLNPGEHLFRLERVGYAPNEQSIMLSEGQQLVSVVPNWEVGSAPSSAADSPARPDTLPNSDAFGPAPFGAGDAPEPSADGGLSPLFWTGVAMTGVFVSVGTITGALALSRAGELDERCDAMGVCGSDQQGTLDDGNALAHVSTVSFALAGAGMALAAVGFAISPSSGETSTAVLRLSPTGISGSVQW